MQYKIGLDIGGTKLEIALLDQTNKLIYSARQPTQRELGYDVILKNVLHLIDDCFIKNKISLNQIQKMGLALPGTVHPQTGIMLLGNTHALENKKIADDIKKELSFSGEVLTENDANCFALAEYKLGLNLNNSSLLGIIIGTGVGGGIILNNHVFSGARGAAIEIGHLSLFEGTTICYCGQTGCGEQFLSGPGLEKDYFERKKQNKKSTEILQDPQEQRLYLKRLSKLIGTVLNIVDVEYVVLGGGLSKQDFIYKTIQEEIQPHLFYKNNPAKILKHTISDSSGSVGAALLEKS